MQTQLTDAFRFYGTSNCQSIQFDAGETGNGLSLQSPIQSLSESGSIGDSLECIFGERVEADI